MNQTEIKEAIAQQEEHIKRWKSCKGVPCVSHRFPPREDPSAISRCTVCGVTETDADYQRSLA